MEQALQNGNQQGCPHVSFGYCGDCKPPVSQHKQLLDLQAKIAQYETELAEYRARNPTVVTQTPPPVVVAPKPGLKLDLGCGKSKKEGFVGVDRLKLQGVDILLDFAKRLPDGTYEKWPWADDSVEEVHCSHTVEHLQFTPEFPERIHFVNELWRVMRNGAKASIIVPNWRSCRMYGDYTHRQPVSEFWPPYLSKKWREDQAPHNDLYTCDFDCTQPGYGGLHPLLQHKSDAFREFAMTFYNEAAGDVMFTLVAKK